MTAAPNPLDRPEIVPLLPLAVDLTGDIPTAYVDARFVGPAVEFLIDHPEKIVARFEATELEGDGPMALRLFASDEEYQEHWLDLAIDPRRHGALMERMASSGSLRIIDPRLRCAEVMVVREIDASALRRASDEAMARLRAEGCITKAAPPLDPRTEELCLALARMPAPTSEHLPFTDSLDAEDWIWQIQERSSDQLIPGMLAHQPGQVATSLLVGEGAGSVVGSLEDRRRGDNEAAYLQFRHRWHGKSNRPVLTIALGRAHIDASPRTIRANMTTLIDVEPYFQWGLVALLLRSRALQLIGEVVTTGTDNDGIPITNAPMIVLRYLPADIAGEVQALLGRDTVRDMLGTSPL